MNVQLQRTATSLNSVVVTALGQTAVQRSLGTSQQTVSGAAVAQTQRENFVNALQGRVAGVNVTSTSGVPGASSSITIRGISSISSSNQPLVILDGLPMDNKTLNTGVLGSDAPGSATAFNNRGLDFTNRAADINPEDIEPITVLKGPEAAALYGIDAANGAIVISTKRGKVGGGLEYSNSFRIEHTGASPEVQKVYGPSAVGSTTYLYFGAPYADTAKLYDNVAGFFRTALTQKHNLSFSISASTKTRTSPGTIASSLTLASRSRRFHGEISIRFLALITTRIRTRSCGIRRVRSVLRGTESSTRRMTSREISTRRRFSISTATRSQRVSR